MPWWLDEVLLYACVGMTLEIVFTAISAWWSKDEWDPWEARRKLQPPGHSARLSGHSYLWMIPIYGLAAPLTHLLCDNGLLTLALPLRMIIYAVTIFAIEYTTGTILNRLLGAAPWEWEYRGRRDAISGLIRLSYAPGFALAGLVFEYVHGRLHPPL